MLDRPIIAFDIETMETLLVFLSWAHHCGWVSTKQLGTFVEAARTAVAREPYLGWRDVEEALRKWPPWRDETRTASMG